MGMVDVSFLILNFIFLKGGVQSQAKILIRTMYSS